MNIELNYQAPYMMKRSYPGNEAIACHMKRSSAVSSFKLAGR
jgi:hypothetical protein